MGHRYFGGLLANPTSLTLGSFLKLTIGYQAFTSLPKQPGSILRQPMLPCRSHSTWSGSISMLPCRSHSTWSGSISNGWSKITSLFSPLKGALFTDFLYALFSTSYAASYNPLVSADWNYSLSLVSCTNLPSAE